MRRSTYLFAGVVMIMCGCHSEGPPNVRYGQEECSHCRMIVNDVRFAAAARTSAGDSHKYDDVCCLVDHMNNSPGHISRKWVRGYHSGRWHDADTAYFVFGPKLQTPMGSGLAAVETKDEADSLAKEWGGRAFRFHELNAFLESKTGANEQAVCPDTATGTEKPSKENP